MHSQISPCAILYIALPMGFIIFCTLLISMDTINPFTSRRSLLKMLSSAPLLPLAGTTTAASLLAACGGDDYHAPFVGTNSQGAFQQGSVTFSGIKSPDLSNPAAMATTYSGAAGENLMTVTLANGKTASYELGYHSFFQTGTLVPDGKGGQILAGGYVDINGKPIMDNTVAGKERQFFSDCPDGSSIITLSRPTVPGVKGNTVFAVVQFEYTTWAQDGITEMYGLLPSPIAVLTLDQNPDTGELKLVQYHNVDTSKVHGLWITCGASLSPWNTHLSSEEYEPDAFALRDKNYMNKFSMNVFGDAAKANVYHYGHLPEVTVNPDGTGSIKKHYCTGRISKELVQVMPDNRTILMGDDWTNGGLFMFVADKEKDLSAGTLYVARWTQTIGIMAGEGNISWINLGHATSAEIEALINGGIQPTDIMDVKTADPLDASYTKIHYSGKFNWIKIKPGMEKAAAFLETHRYAAFVGASMCFTKMEGTTLNAKDKKAYSAMSRIESSMLQGNVASLPGHVEVQGPYSGAVYEHTLKGGQKDSNNAAISSDWVSTHMAAVPALISEDIGMSATTPYVSKKNQDALGNFANPDKIATPDNLKFDERMRTLFIGEDSNTHVNNFLWAYNVDTKKLSRILSTPAGAESTGLHAVTNINGWTYIMSNFQHAGDWDKKGLHSKVWEQLDPLINANWNNKFGASVGYMSGKLLSVK